MTNRAMCSLPTHGGGRSESPASAQIGFIRLVEGVLAGRAVYNVVRRLAMDMPIYAKIYAAHG